MNFVLSFIASILHVLFLASPSNSYWARIILLIVRLFTLSILSRNFLLPWLISVVSKRMRVKSISLTSIRGLYIRTGTQIIRVDRISWSWLHVNGLHVKLQGLFIEVRKAEPPPSPQPIRKGNRNLTLADLAPSSFAHRLFAWLYSAMEPFLRPIARGLVVTCLRALIRWLPNIISNITFELLDTSLNLPHLMDASISIHGITFHTGLKFTQLGNVGDNVQETTQRQRKRRLLAMSAWRKRLEDSFQRALDRAWGKAHGTATIDLQIHGVAGTFEKRLEAPFLKFPGAVNLAASMKFSPREASLDANSLVMNLDIEDVYLQLNNLQKLLSALDQLKAHSPRLASRPLSPTSPWPFLTATTPIPSSFSVDSEHSFFPSSAGLSPAKDASLSAALASPPLPTSPLLDMLSGSIRARRRHYVPRTPRLKDFKDTSLVAILSRATVKISTIKCAASLLPEREQYETTISEITLAASPMKCLPESDFHDSIVGSRRKKQDFDTESYGLNFSIYQIVIARRERLHSLRLLKLGQISLEASALQWPTPWLKPSPFLKGDPNAAFVSARLSIEDIQAADRIDHFQKLLDYLRSPKPPKVRSPRSPTLDLSRVALELHCGSISGRLILIDTSVGPRALEVYTDGVLVTLTSEFVSPGQRKTLPTEHDLSRQQLRMILHPTLVLEPVTIQLQPAMTAAFTYTNDSNLTDPTSPISLLSLDQFAITGDAHLVSFFNPDVDSVPSVVLSTAVLNLHLSSEKISVELWHPDALAVTRRVLELAAPRDETQPATEPLSPAPPLPLLDRLPAGIVLTLAMGRVIVMLTAPDIYPSESSGLTRGLSLTTGVCLHYSSLHTSHTYRFSNLPNDSLLRHKLSLPEEQVVEAFSAAQASAITQRASAHARFTLTNTTVNNIIATANGVINVQPILGAGVIEKYILFAKKVQVNLHLSGKRGTSSGKVDGCQVSISAPDNRISWQLADVYAALLVVEVAKSLSPLTKSRTKIRPMNSRPPLDVQIDVSIGTIQLLSSLPNEKIAIRLDAISVRQQEAGITVHLPRTTGWVSMPSKVNSWDEDVGEKWEELAVITSLHTALKGSHLAEGLTVEAESAKLRIPFGYVLANLIQDISVSLKAIKHLVRTTAAGVYSDPSNPEAEAPKIIPHITVKLRYLSVEAADDHLESKLSVVWRCGAEAVKHRMEREEAFLAKLEAIAQSYRGDNPPSDDDDDSAPEFDFDAEHTVSIEDARRRLDGVHELDWTFRLRALRTRQAEFEEATQQLLGRRQSKKTPDAVPNIVKPSPIALSPPLFRLTLQNVGLDLQTPSFPVEDLANFLFDNGGLPLNTEFSLLVPLNLHLTTTALQASLRDYPLPLLSISPNGKGKNAVFDFKTDLVIAEEMGTDASVDWKICEILKPNEGVAGASGFTFDIPKTIMPVKTYANPVITVSSDSPTIISWGVSYMPAIQDFVKVIETLSTPPRDSSPAVGFWDKLRLILHWKTSINFMNEVRCHLKGSRDPNKITDDGTGFVLSWREHPRLLINHPNESGELLQVMSGSMYIAIPNLENFHPRHYRHSFAPRTTEANKPFHKVCAKLRSGVQFGIGCVLERSCGEECDQCSGPAFHRKCRLFDFLPHYKVRLEKKTSIPVIKTPEDSFNGFRSDFIHMSISLRSSTLAGSPSLVPSSSNLHLTPKAFAHFWAWCSLFNGALSLPTRQGSYYPSRTISPKLGRHLATLKYRTHFPDLYVMHAYIDESRETWADGVAPWIGVKGKVHEFQVDLHQREEELTVSNILTEGKKVVRRKSLYAAEVSLKDLDLRVLLATFEEPLKREVEMSAPTQRSNYRSHKGLPTTSPASPWYDVEDFIETDWSTSRRPVVHLLPLVTCPHFTYLNRKGSTNKNVTETSKFGLEKSHSCLLGTEQSVAQIQSGLVKARIQELKATLVSNRVPGTKRRGSGFVPASTEKMISLLEEYQTFLQETPASGSSADHNSAVNYLLPFDALSSDEWADFENVYQIHCPVVFMDVAIRDIILQYYYCSRARKGFEYHMATRAIKFIRDQAGMSHEDLDLPDLPASEKAWGGATAHMAATALRKIWKGDSSKPSLDIVEEPDETEDFDPLAGWSEGVSLSKSHCCLLVKPQIVLREDQSKETLVVAAVQAKLRMYAIMDDSNVEDHISGKIMSRSYTSLSGLQIFAPVGNAMLRETHVPLEVLIDLRCESTEFDRVVPQTDAKFHYDKFNRLRLRNNITSAKHNFGEKDSHLNDQNDLIRVHVPQFTVSANDEHFQAISQIVTKLVLFSDAAHKVRLEKLETLLYTYDFTDLRAAAKLVSDLRDQINDALETQNIAQNHSNPRLSGDEGQVELLKLQAHIFLLTEELNFIYDAIKLAQDRFDDQTEQKSALLLHASSSQISWRMLDDRKDLLAKLVVENIDFSWLSRQDSSTGNNLTVGNLQAFDGSRFAVWAEILSKHYEPANHPLLKKGLFMLASWSVLAPVGGITIYESFELTLHPIRLQVDARVGRRIMEYLWPERKRRNQVADQAPAINVLSPTSPGRTSLDSPRGLQSFKPIERAETSTTLAPPTLRRLAPSRSFTDLRNSAKGTLMPPTSLTRQKSSDNVRQNTFTSEFGEKNKGLTKKEGDAAEMKIRASQKTFVMVKISSLHLLLSIAKEGSFECRDAKIRTRDLEYRNQTWSFEELVNQFIPSDTSWRGWVKMAFHQPLLPVLPVARELFSKTKLLGGSKAAPEIDEKGPAPKLPRAKALSGDDDKKVTKMHSRHNSQTKSPVEGEMKSPPIPKITRLPLTDEPEGFASDTETSPTGKSMLSRRKSSSRSARFKTLLGRKSPRADSSRTSVKSPKSPPASERPSTSSR